MQERYCLDKPKGQWPKPPPFGLFRKNFSLNLRRRIDPRAESLDRLRFL